MGSRKKKDAPENTSSSSASESESSESSKERRLKRKSKKRLTHEPTSNFEDSKPTKKIKPKSKKEEQSAVEYENDDVHGRKFANEKREGRDSKDTNYSKRRPSTFEENKSRNTTNGRRQKEDRGRADDTRSRNNDYSRSYDDRHREERRSGHRAASNRKGRNDEREFRNRREEDRDYNYRQRNRPNFVRRRSRSNSFDHANAKWGKEQTNKKPDKKDTKDKQKPNFALSGKLAEETNTYHGVVIKYSEPPEARKPKRRWRLYPFKGEKALQTLYIHRESAYLIGRDRKVVDLPIDHPSCSKQHAALQYRLVPFTRDDGSSGKRVRPYLIDLNSANGTYINNKKVDPSKYVELLEKDVIKFGFSSREYVLLHENSKDEAQDDDVKQEVPVKSEEN